MGMTTYHNRLAEVISFNKERIDVGIKVLVQEIISRVKLSKNIWLIGNGGSASTAEHFETDLTFIRQDTLTGFPLVTALTSNSALVTALSNDLSYDEVFSVLIKRKARKEDLLIAISASGNSKNIENAILQAKSQGVKTFLIKVPLKKKSG